jgi:hypothetical protein
MMASLTARAIVYSRRKSFDTHIIERPLLPCQPMLPRISASRSLRARCVRDSFSHRAMSATESTPVGMRSASASAGAPPQPSQSLVQSRRHRVN